MRLVLTQPVLSTDPNADNTARMEQLLVSSALELSADDIVVLPEHSSQHNDWNLYQEQMCGLATRLGCHLIAGSIHARDAAHVVNRGLVATPSGALLTQYEKLRPYFREQQLVTPGDHFGEVDIAGKRFVILICADFWFSDLFDRIRKTPDVVVVPSLSVTRKPTPDYSRELWRHLAVARAYEFGVYIGISDWDNGSTLGELQTAGVAGFADPTQLDPQQFFKSAPPGGVLAMDLDFDALAAFREDRRRRGFFWRPEQPENLGVGLCAHCRHARSIQSSKGSQFYLCERHTTDPTFAKYPRLPMLNCDGFESA